MINQYFNLNQFDKRIAQTVGQMLEQEEFVNIFPEILFDSDIDLEKVKRSFMIKEAGIYMVDNHVGAQVVIHRIAVFGNGDTPAEAVEDAKETLKGLRAELEQNSLAPVKAPNKPAAVTVTVIGADEDEDLNVESDNADDENSGLLSRIRDIETQLSTLNQLL